MPTEELVPIRPDIAAAIRGGDTEQGMETEADPLTGTLEQVLAGIIPVALIGITADAVLALVQRILAKGRVTVAAT